MWVAHALSMSMTSKSPSQVASLAYEAGKKALPKYAHKFSRKDFTCAQLFAILVLRKFMKQDYRGVACYLCEWSDLRRILDLDDAVPHYTTLQKNNAKLLNDALLRKQTLEPFYRYPKHAVIDDEDMAWMQRIDLAAGDSTGFASGRCSAYFAKRKKQGRPARQRRAPASALPPVPQARHRDRLCDAPDPQPCAWARAQA